MDSRGRFAGRREALERLSEKHREVLRLAAQGYQQSKEIAPLINRSVHTVDDRFREILPILGAATRAEATRIWREGVDGDHQPLIPQPPALPNLDRSAFLAATPNRGGAVATGAGGHQVEDSIAPHAGFAPPLSDLRRPSVFGERRRNDLTIYARVVRIIVLMILLATAVGVLVVGAVGVTATLRAILGHTATTLTI